MLCWVPPASGHEWIPAQRLRATPGSSLPPQPPSPSAGFWLISGRLGHEAGLGPVRLEAGELRAPWGVSGQPAVIFSLHLHRLAAELTPVIAMPQNAPRCSGLPSQSHHPLPRLPRPTPGLPRCTGLPSPSSDDLLAQALHRPACRPPPSLSWFRLSPEPHHFLFSLPGITHCYSLLVIMPSGFRGSS